MACKLLLWLTAALQLLFPERVDCQQPVIRRATNSTSSTRHNTTTSSSSPPCTCTATVSVPISTITTTRNIIGTIFVYYDEYIINNTTIFSPSTSRPSTSTQLTTFAPNTTTVSAPNIRCSVDDSSVPDHSGCTTLSLITTGGVTYHETVQTLFTTSSITILMGEEHGITTSTTTTFTSTTSSSTSPPNVPPPPPPAPEQGPGTTSSTSTSSSSTSSQSTNKPPNPPQGPAPVITTTTRSNPQIQAPGGSGTSNTVSATTPGPAPLSNTQTSTPVVLTPNAAGQYTFSRGTLVPGGAPAIVDGTTYSIASASNAVVVNGQTSSFPSTTAPSLTVAGQIITADPAGRYVLAGQTLVAGGAAITVSGSTYSLATGGTALLVNTQTITLTSIAHGLPTLTLGSPTLSTDSVGNFVVGAQTLKPGGSAIVVSGVTYSLAASGSSVVRISDGTTTTEGLGAAIMSGLGQSGNATASTPGPAMFTGAAAKAQDVRRNVVIMLGAVLPVLGF